MRNINESMARIQTLTAYLNEKREGAVDEGLKDFINNLKARFAKVVQWIKGFAVKLSNKLPYWCPSDGEEIDGAILPATAGEAMKGGYIDKKTTNVVLSKDSSKLCGYKGDPEDGKKLYGSGNTLQYIKRMMNESSLTERPMKAPLDTRPLTMEDLEADPMKAVMEMREQMGDEIISEAQIQNTDASAKYNVVDNDKLIALIKMRLKNPKLPVLLIWGAPGIGKTAILEATIKAWDPTYDLICKTLSNETPDNFTLPEYKDTAMGRRKVDIPASWMPVYDFVAGDDEGNARRDAACGKGLLFIDELSRATDQVLNVILPLVNERRFNNYKLGSGWTIVCATNRLEDEMSGQAQLGKALKNRFANVYFEPTCDTWMQWAKKQKFISPFLLQWLSLPETESMSGGKFFYADPEDDTDDPNPMAVMATPRSWSNAMYDLAEFAGTGSLEGWTIFDIPKDDIRMILNMYVQNAAVDAFMGFLSLIRDVGDVEKISKDVWKTGKAKVDIKAVKTAAIPLAQVIVTAHSTTLPTEDEFTNLAQWVVDLNWGQMAAYIMDIFQNVFIPDNCKQKQKSIIYTSPAYRQKIQGADLAQWNNFFPEMFAKYGISSIHDIPDYSKGLQLMGKKYAAEVGKYIDGV